MNRFPHGRLMARIEAWALFFSFESARCRILFFQGPVLLLLLWQVNGYSSTAPFIYRVSVLDTKYVFQNSSASSK